MIAVLTGIVFLSNLFSCKKDKEDEPVKKYRLKTLKRTDSDGTSFGQKYIYNADNKITKVVYESDDEEFLYYELNYAGDSVYISEFFKNNDGTWEKRGSLTTVTFKNGRIYHSETVSSFNEIVATMDYTWNGDLLEKEIYKSYNFGYNTFSRVWEYGYQNKLLTTTTEYYDDDLSDKKIIEYTNGKPVVIKNYDENDHHYSTTQIQYTGERATSLVECYIQDGEVQEDYCYSEERTFDSRNLLTKATYLLNGNYRFETIALYEDGTSNYNELLLDESQYANQCLFPDTFTSIIWAK